jgi:5-methylthioadenosine/S-adenosylhomocysteine deaminase
MATREGARALGLEREIGSIEAGKCADLIIINRRDPGLSPDPDPWWSIVYAARGTDVLLTMVDGEVLGRERQLVREDAAEIAGTARDAARQLASRAGVR